MIRKIGATVAAGLLLLASHREILAADVTTPDFGIASEGSVVTTPSGWTFGIAPYMWAAGANGEAGVGGLPPVSFDASFEDIVEHLDIAAMLVGEARYGRFGIFSDFFYTEVSGSGNTPLGILAKRVDVTSSVLIWTAAAEYRVVETPIASIDAMAGVRVWALETDLDFVGGVFGPTTLSGSQSWVDPMLGLKGTADLSARWYVSGWAMIGGFDVGSDFMWDLWAGVGYRFTDAFSMVAGYRGLGVDYSNDGFVFDVVQHGPVLGAAFRF